MGRGRKSGLPLTKHVAVNTAAAAAQQVILGSIVLQTGDQKLTTSLEQMRRTAPLLQTFLQVFSTFYFILHVRGSFHGEMPSNSMLQLRGYAAQTGTVC